MTKTHLAFGKITRFYELLHQCIKEPVGQPGPIVFFLPFSSIALGWGWLWEQARNKQGRCVLRAAKPAHATAMGRYLVTL